jgi:hypothetical protein
VTTKLAQTLDDALAAAAETEVEGLRRFLEVSQTALEVAEREMQVVRDQQVAADSRVANEFSFRYSDLMGCIRFLHSLCPCVEQRWRRSC